jgi:hypothetical protein
MLFCVTLLALQRTLHRVKRSHRSGFRVARDLITFGIIRLDDNDGIEN